MVTFSFNFTFYKEQTYSDVKKKNNDSNILYKNSLYRKLHSCNRNNEMLCTGNF